MDTFARLGRGHRLTDGDEGEGENEEFFDMEEGHMSLQAQLVEFRDRMLNKKAWIKWFMIWQPYSSGLVVFVALMLILMLLKSIAIFVADAIPLLIAAGLFVALWMCIGTPRRSEEWMTDPLHA
jgi:hypothetical protein